MSTFFSVRHYSCRCTKIKTNKGAYINIGNAGFQSVRNGEYVDKSGLISIVNGALFTERRFSCVSRSRRFGKSVAGEMVNAVKISNWNHVTSAIEKSKQLLQTTLRGDEEAVARGVDATHDENTSILSYNDENSIACVLSIAYYYAFNDYIIHRELAIGKGIADLVLIPRKNVDSPAIIIK